MMIAVNVCLMICLFFIAFQDFKQREIAMFFIPILFIGFVYVAFQSNFFDVALNNLIFNLSFVIVQLVISTIYISVKKNKVVNIVDTYIGAGDILFYVVIAAAFSPFNFIVFCSVGMILTILGVLLFNLFKQSSKELPLAGSMATMMMVLMIVNFCLPNMNFYNDDFFFSCFVK